MDTKEREPSRQDVKVATPLEQEVIDAIYEDIPINLICHRCEVKMPIDGVLDPDAKYDREDWIKLAARIISIVKE